VTSGGTPDLVISPDGTQIVYVADVADGAPGGQLYVQVFDQLDAVLLRGAVGAINPFISPDSDSVGYFSFQDRTLKRVPIQGGPPITLAAVGGIDGASWGPDDTILFAERGISTGSRRRAVNPSR